MERKNKTTNIGKRHSVVTVTRLLTVRAEALSNRTAGRRPKAVAGHMKSHDRLELNSQ